MPWLCGVLLHHARLCYAILRVAMPGYAVLRHALTCYIYYAVLFYAVLYYAIICCTTPCYYACLCYAILFYTILPYTTCCLLTAFAIVVTIVTWSFFIPHSQAETLRADAKAKTEQKVQKKSDVTLVTAAAACVGLVSGGLGDGAFAGGDAPWAPPVGALALGGIAYAAATTVSGKEAVYRGSRGGGWGGGLNFFGGCVVVYRGVVVAFCCCCSCFFVVGTRPWGSFG